MSFKRKREYILRSLLGTVAALTLGIIALPLFVPDTKYVSVGQASGWTHYTETIESLTSFETEGGHLYYLAAPKESIPLAVTSSSVEVAIPVGPQPQVGSTLRYSCTTPSRLIGIIDPTGSALPYVYWPGRCFSDKFQVSEWIPFLKRF